MCIRECIRTHHKKIGTHGRGIQYGGWAYRVCDERPIWFYLRHRIKLDNKGKAAQTREEFGVLLELIQFNRFESIIYAFNTSLLTGVVITKEEIGRSCILCLAYLFIARMPTRKEGLYHLATGTPNK